MLGLDAIEQHGARVLFIAAEDANGVAKTRLPAACEARGKQLAEIDPLRALRHVASTLRHGFDFQFPQLRQPRRVSKLMSKQRRSGPTSTRAREAVEIAKRDYSAPDQDRKIERLRRENPEPLGGVAPSVCTERWIVLSLPSCVVPCIRKTHGVFATPHFVNLQKER